MDSYGQILNLKCVNWYGMHLENLVVGGLNVQKLKDIIEFGIVKPGFNCVRLPY